MQNNNNDDNYSLGRGLESLIPNKAVPSSSGINEPLSSDKNQAPPPFVIHKHQEGDSDARGGDSDQDNQQALPDPLHEPELPDPLEDPELPAGDDIYIGHEEIQRKVEKTEPNEAPTTSKSVTMPELSADEPPKQGESIFYLEVEKIKSNPHQPRRDFNDEALKDLASSIREFGVLQPLVVTKNNIDTPNGTDVQYELIAGERRLKASKLAGLERVPAIVRHVGLERERLEMAIIENLQREDLNPIEMARAFSRLQDEFRLTQREIASRLGKSRETVANTLRLLDLPHDIQQALAEQKISESHGRLLLGIENPGLREKLFRDLLDNPITTRELRKRIRTITRKTENKINPTDNSSPELKMIEERLRSELGTPVDIKSKGDHGKITISFYSKEELMGIIERFKRDR